MPPERLALYALLVLAGVGSGFISTVAGGGSLLTLPALMLLGLPPHVANGSNRLAMVTQSLSGVAAYRKKGALDDRGVLPVVVPTVLGACVGALGAAYAPQWILQPVLLSAMVGMALLMLARKTLFTPPNDEAELGLRDRPLAAVGLFAAGLYGGFVQAGVGFVLLGVLGGLLRRSLVRANALKLACTSIFSVAALAVFVAAGQVAWVPAVVLAVATVAGSQLGVRFAVKTQPRTLRLIVLAAVLASVIAILLR